MTQHLDALFLDYPQHLTVANLASLLGVTQKTAYEYLQSAEIPSYRIGTRWLVLRDEVKEYIQTQARTVKSSASV